VRTRIKGDLDTAIGLLNDWAKNESIELKEQRKTFFNIYYHAVKSIDGKEMLLHIVASTLPEDPGNVHVSFRSYDKPDVRKPLEDSVGKAEQLLWDDGRKIDN
jgi:hypothetical protein